MPFPWFGSAKRNSPRPVVQLPIPKAPPPPPQPVEMLPVHYCDNDECNASIDAIDVKDILYGCASHDREKLSRYSDLPEELAKQFKPGPAALAGGLVKCPEHYLSLVAFCPYCKKPMGRDSATPPIGIWGAQSAGKTVFCAAMVQEIEKRLFTMCGIIARFGFDLRSYRRVVVNPLRDFGMVPAKTQPGEHRGIVIRLTQLHRLARKFKMTDMDGAYYTEFFTSGGAQPHEESLTRLIHFTREAIFLISPDQAGAVGAAAQPDLFPVVSALLVEWEKWGLLATFDVQRVQFLLHAAVKKLREYEYPAPDAVNLGYQRLARDLLALLGNTEPRLLRSTEHKLEEIASSTAEGMSMAAQLDGLENQLRTWNFPETADGRLDLRLALTITKSDLLLTRDEELRKVGDMAPKAGASSSREEWRSAVRTSSDQARAVLMRYDQQVVARAESAFRDVGYFFATSLGRDTELLATASVSADQSESEDSEYPGDFKEAFTVRKRLPPGRDGSRRPEPRGVLTPLLWILMGD